jgi:site-specific DNA-methyltransferase (adenine-specific)
MQIYSQKSEYTLLQGNMLDMWDFVGGGTIDSIVTDPPYELNFMWKWWDNSWIAFQPDTWKRCLEALKPWWYLLAFGGSRTYHRIACAIEDAGFEIRDCIMWLYGSWFPKSMNIWLAIDKKNWVDNRTGSIKEWVGSNNTLSMRNWLSESMEFKSEYEERKATNERAWWGTALKPSYEPIIVARKPLEWSCTDNVIKYWVGGINIDECRVGTETISIHNAPAGTFAGGEYDRGSDTESYRDSVGRFPANTILTYDESDFEEVCWWFPYTKSTWGSWIASQINTFKNVRMWANWKNTWANLGWLWDEWSAARYFYNAKASRRDRDEGLDWFEAKTKVFNGQSDKPSEDMKDVEKRFTTVGRNSHPTVKPTSLMQYLVRLVTPNGWTVLDPFNWSGSTGKAVMYENKDRNKNYKYIWIELTEEYLPIAKARIEYVINKGIEKEKSEPKQEEQTKQRKESALF